MPPLSSVCSDYVIFGDWTPLKGHAACFQHDEKLQKLFDRQVQSHKLQSDEGIVLSEILKRAVQPRAAGDLHTCGDIGEDALATGLDKLSDLSVNG